jgi:uncharacterized protein (DUF427 family)
MRLAKDA